MSPQKALVTGAGGFVGANLVRVLLSRGHDVIAIVRPGADAWRLEELKLDVRQVDVRDAAGIATVMDDVRPAWVFHLAAHGAYSWQGERDAIFATNLDATKAVVDAAVSAGVTAIVHAGSSSEYGPKGHAPREDEPLEPAGDYARSKAAATLYCSETAARTGARIVTLRLYSAYGPYEDPRRFIPTLLTHALAGRLPPLVAAETPRDFVFVEDVCDAFLRATDAPPGGVYNVASGRQTTIRDVVEIARGIFDVDEEPEWGTMPQRAWDTSVWVGDPSRVAAELGWHASTSLEDGLKATAEWIAASAARARYRLDRTPG